MSTSTDSQYKVKYGCTNCGRIRETKWKETPDLPHRCHLTEDGEGCGKSRSNLSLHKVWKKGEFGEKILIKDVTGKSNTEGDRRW